MIDRDLTIRLLKGAIDQAGIAGDLRRVAAHYGMPTGRKWADIPDEDLDLLLRHTVGQEPLPAGPTDTSIKPDDSNEGRTLNERITKIGL